MKILANPGSYTWAITLSGMTVSLLIMDIFLNYLKEFLTSCNHKQN